MATITSRFLQAPLPTNNRLLWVDYAKGISICLVVMMHSTLGVEEAFGRQGWMQYVVQFAEPFRMPAFFFVAGLFLSRTIDQKWSVYSDKKVVHFLYFYIIWLTISFMLKGSSIAMSEGIGAAIIAYLTAFIIPFGTLWFIYVLPVFFVVAKLIKSAPKFVVIGIASVLNILPISTGYGVADVSATYFIFFYAGYVFADSAFKFTAYFDKCRLKLFLISVFWLVGNGLLVFTEITNIPAIMFLLNLAGIVGVISISNLLAKHDVIGWLRYIGSQSLIIYLAFFIPMVIGRIVLIKTGFIDDIGTVSLLVSIGAIVGPLIMLYLVERIKIGTFSLQFLFFRPFGFKLNYTQTPEKAAIAVK